MGVYKRLIITFGCILIILFLIDLIVSIRTKHQSQLSQTLQKLTALNNEPEVPTKTIQPTVNPVQGFPRSYKNISIPSEIYTNAMLRYHNVPEDESRQYVIDLVHRYYIYRDYLILNNIPFEAQNPVSWKTISEDTPKMEELINQNLISYVDFAYIKVRFRYAAEEERIKRIYGDPKKKAYEVISKYKERFSDPEADLNQIIADSNEDIDIITLNGGEDNGIETNYTFNKHLFFTDTKFNLFLFAQKQRKVSNIYTLLGKTNDEYAYVIVYPIFVQKKPLSSIDDMIKRNLQYFKDN